MADCCKKFVEKTANANKNFGRPRSVFSFFDKTEGLWLKVIIDFRTEIDNNLRHRISLILKMLKIKRHPTDVNLVFAFTRIF
jgi:hypothetical protein